MSMTLEAAAKRLGREHGLSVASWIDVDPGDARTIVEDVDPEVEDRYSPPAPLAYEYADDPTMEEVIDSIYGEAGVERPEDDWVTGEELARAYEDAYYEAAREDLARKASELLA